MRTPRKKSATATSETAAANAKSEPKGSSANAAHAKRIAALEARVQALVEKLGGILGTNVED